MKLINLSWILLLAPSMTLAQNSFEECNSLWRKTSEMAKCQMAANEAKEREISVIIKTIAATFKDKDQITAVLNTQKNWELYVDSECSSRVIPGASGSSNGVYLQSCIHDKLQNRIQELKRYHDCNDNGCPERIEDGIKQDASI